MGKKLKEDYRGVTLKLIPFHGETLFTMSYLVAAGMFYMDSHTFLGIYPASRS